jgi:hypothetical protein
MSDDRLLLALGQLAREQRHEEEPPPELLAPPSEDAKDRIVAQALASIVAEASDDEAELAAVRAQTQPPPPRQRRRWWLWIGTPVALAAGVTFWFYGRATDALPRYAMEISGGAAAYRAAQAVSDEPLVIEAGSSVEIRLRPETDSAQPIAVRAFWVKGHAVRAWSAEMALSPHGAVRLRGPGEQPLGAGEGEIVAVVAPSGALAGDISTVELTSPPAGWQLFRRRVRWP